MLLLGYAIDFPWFDCYLPVNATVTDISIAMLPDGEASERGLLSWPTGLALAFQSNGIDVLLVLLTIVIMQSFKSFESVLLLLLAFVGQLFMLHSCDLVSFYICLEAQNFCFLVLCGLQPRIFKYSTSRGSRPLAGVEASIKYLLLSAFSSGVLLFWFSILYLRTGITALPSLAMSMSASPAATGLASWGSFAPQSPDGAMQPMDTFAGVATSISFSGNLFARPLDALKAVQPDQAMLGGAEDVVPQMLILIALMFKLGGAPLHI
jgi:NADH:ubiquinone oxidoreductase subunit 2 (subunit N)